MRRKAERSTATNKPEQNRDHHGFRGVPPPADFSLTALPDDALLTEFEIASVLRVSTNTVSSWRRQLDHPLAWEVLPNGFIRYRAGALCFYLALGRPRQQERLAAGEEPTVAVARAEPAPEAAAPQPLRGVEWSVALQRAIALFGSQQRLARAAGVHVNSIWKVLHQHGAIGPKLALAIERATGGQVQADELMLEGRSAHTDARNRRAEDLRALGKIAHRDEDDRAGYAEAYARKAPRHRERHGL
jgi:DNA-binding transcriptional regulator YdaS (Cro superfamily)